GKSPSTQAGEFVREEMEHIRKGKHGAQSTKQAIAIGLSKARRAGVKLRAPRRGKTSAATRRKAQRDLRRHRGPAARRRARATARVLRRKPRSAATRTALARQARASAKRRGPRKRSQAARKAARTRARRAR